MELFVYQVLALHLVIGIMKFLKRNNMKCENEKCTRTATIKNQEYHPDKWLCTFHANKSKVEGRQKRKKLMKKITPAEIERFYNKGRESDVPYTYIRNMSPTTIKMIIEILQNR